MSVTFCVRTPGGDLPTEINLANPNARELLEWIGLDAGEFLWGEVQARELAALCRRRLWNEARNDDPEVADELEEVSGRCTVHRMGRRAGYLREKTEALLAVAAEAGDGSAYWC